MVSVVVILPCSLLFTIIDEWLHTVELVRFDCAMTNEVTRRKYFASFSAGKALLHHTIYVSPESMRWMSSRKLPSSALCIRLNNFHLLLSRKEFSLDTSFVTTLSIDCCEKILASQKRLRDMFKCFPRLESVCISGSYYSGTESQRNQCFFDDMISLQANCPKLRTVHFNFVEELTDSSLLFFSTHCEHLKVVKLTCCPNITVSGIVVCLQSSNTIQELIWCSIDNVREGSLDAVCGHHYPRINSNQEKWRLCLSGPGFSERAIIALSQAVIGFTSIVVTNMEYVNVDSIVDIVWRHVNYLRDIALFQCRSAPRALFDVLASIRPGQLRCIQIDSLALAEVDTSSIQWSIMNMIVQHGANLHKLQLSGTYSVDDDVVLTICRRCRVLRELSIENNPALTPSSLVALDTEFSTRKEMSLIHISRTLSMPDDAVSRFSRLFSGRILWR